MATTLAAAVQVVGTPLHKVGELHKKLGYPAKKIVRLFAMAAPTCAPGRTADGSRTHRLRRRVCHAAVVAGHGAGRKQFVIVVLPVVGRQFLPRALVVLGEGYRSKNAFWGGGRCSRAGRRPANKGRPKQTRCRKVREPSSRECHQSPLKKSVTLTGAIVTRDTIRMEKSESVANLAQIDRGCRASVPNKPRGGSPGDASSVGGRVGHRAPAF